MAARGWLLVALSLASCAPRAPARTIRFQSTVHSARLPSGLRVLVVEDHDTNLVELGIRVDAGGIDDPPRKAGLAHLVEHLMFQVESPPDRRPVLARLAAVALAFNAYTSWEATSFTAVARADQLTALLDVEAHRFAAACPAMSQQAFEREREVVRNELRLRRSFLGGEAGIADLAYPPDHPYARPAVGSDATVSRLALADACAFIDAHYQPNRMVVMVTGDVEAMSAIRAVGATLGRLAGRSAGRRRPPPRALPAMRRVSARLFASDRPVLLVEWPMPPRYAPSYPAAQLALSLADDELSDGGPGGAMVVELGTARAPLAVAAVLLPPGTADARAIAESLDRVDRAIARSRRHLGWDQVVERMANRHARRLLASFDRMSTRVAVMAEAFQLAGDDHIVAHQLMWLDEIRGDDIHAASERLFARERRSVVMVTPPATEARASAPDPGPSYAGRRHEQEWHAPAEMREADRPLSMPLPRERTRVQRYRLANGLTVVLLPRPAVPLVNARLVFAGGSADDPAGQEGLAAAAAHLLTFRRVGSISRSVTPRERLFYFGDDLDVDVGLDHTTFRADGLSSHLDALVSGLASLVADGEYRDRDLAIWGRRPGGRALARAVPVGPTRFRAHRRMRAALSAALFGARHPYARAAQLSDEAGPPRIDRFDLEVVRDRRFGAANGVLILCGAFDPELAREHIEHWFDDLRRGERHALRRPPVRPQPGLIAEPTDAADPTTTIQIAFAGRADPGRRAVRRVIARMVEERMRRLREALGAAYVVGVAYQDDPGGGALQIVATVDATRSGEAIDLMMEELDRLRAGDGDLAEAFVRARRQVLQVLVAQRSGAESNADRIEWLIARGSELGDDARLARQVMDLTMERARAALAEELATSREVIGLVGSPASVAAARRGADR